MHRYKFYVIQKILADKYSLAVTAGGEAPWQALFARGVLERSDGYSDLVPYWIFEEKWKFEGSIPIFSPSRETSQLEDLKRSLVRYRLVFGQSRQEELLRLPKSHSSSTVSSGDLQR